MKPNSNGLDDFIEIENQRIYFKSSENMREVEDNSIQLIVTSPLQDSALKKKETYRIRLTLIKIPNSPTFGEKHHELTILANHYCNFMGSHAPSTINFSFFLFENCSFT